MGDAFYNVLIVPRTSLITMRIVNFVSSKKDETIRGLVESVRSSHEDEHVFTLSCNVDEETMILHLAHIPTTILHMLKKHMNCLQPVVFAVPEIESEWKLAKMFNSVGLCKSFDSEEVLDNSPLAIKKGRNHEEVAAPKTRPVCTSPSPVVRRRKVPRAYSSDWPGMSETVSDGKRDWPVPVAK